MKSYNINLRRLVKVIALIMLSIFEHGNDFPLGIEEKGL